MHRPTLTRVLLWTALALTAVSHAASPSPTDVLRQTDAKLGSGYVSLPPSQVLAGEDGRPEAPYFHVPDGSVDALPLKETSATVDIAGVIARVKIKQVFENRGPKPIEAVYVFPGSTRSAVHGMRMRIGDRILEAKIDKKEAARQTYEAARNAGQRASLLEQQRPNVFTMNVANLMPKDRIEVELEYSEFLVPRDSVYEFVYPTVVGPRYKAIPNPYLQEGASQPFKFDLRVHLETGISLKELSSPSHELAVTYTSASGADVALAREGGGNKDFVLRYRLAGDKIETGLLLFPGEKENFFALMLEPPRRPTQSQIPPREYIFVLDVSGSMHGFPLETAKQLMGKLLKQLRPTDTFNVVLFSGASHVMSPEGSLPASGFHVDQASQLISEQRGGGGTELLAALRNAYAIPKKQREASRTVVVVTDGYVGVEAQSYKFIREHLHEANLFAFGIGSSVNRALIEGMARAGQGEPFVVLKPEEAPQEAERLRQYIAQPVLSGIDLRFKGFDAYEVAPARQPDLLAQRPVVVFGKYRGAASGQIELSGFTGGGRHTQSVQVASSRASSAHAPLRWLWARKWVEILEDQYHLTGASEVSDAITDLGLAYTLLTPFTSFVAVDSAVVNSGGSQTRVQQPLPLPEGVSNHAVGMQIQAAYGAPAGASPVPRLHSMAKRAAPSRPEPLAAAPAKEEAELKGVAADVKKERALTFAWLAGQHLLDTAALENRFRQLLSGTCVESGTLTVELGFSPEGKLLSVEVGAQGADSALRRCVRTALLNLQNDKLGSGAGVARLRISLR